MLSPIPLGPEAPPPPLMSPGDQLLATHSPALDLTFPSPGLGRTPGAHVVQEGRLSLEMLGLIMPEAAANTGVPPIGILAPFLNAEASVRAGILKSECHAGFLNRVSCLCHDTPLGCSYSDCFFDFSAGASIENPSGNQQPKLTPPVLATATSEQLNAKVSQFGPGFVFSTTKFE
jgi:hypothetical protein